MTLDYKGLVYALDKWSDAQLPYRGNTDMPDQIAEVPRINFTLGLMFSAGIRTFMIASTADGIPNYQEILKDGSQFDARVSYLLLVEDAGVADAVAQANEFIAQSPLVLVAAGVCCAGPGVTEKLQGAMQFNRGTTAFRMGKGAYNESCSCSELLLLDGKSQNSVMQLVEESMPSMSFEELKNYCASNTVFSEIDWGTQCSYVDFFDSPTIEEQAMIASEIGKERIKRA